MNQAFAMALIKRLALTCALVAGTWAQSSDGETLWAVAAYINHGEKTPLDGTVLTPEGAQQLLRQGRAFRARYLANVSGSDYDHIQPARLQTMPTDMIDNGALDLGSLEYEYVTTSAMSFLQGLYPPASDAFGNSTDDSDIARDYSQDNNTLIDYPLNGYQYANIRTYGVLDQRYTGIQGNLRCSNWVSEMYNNLTQDPYMSGLADASLEFYQQLFSEPPLQGTVNTFDANLWNAYELYQLVNYLYNHNQTVHDELTNATSKLTLMNVYAATLERSKNAYLNDSSSDGNDDKEILYSIAGRTLANRISRQLLDSIRWNGSEDKMSITFGTFQPIMSFLSLSGLINREAVQEGPFSTLPQPGAAMVFEVYGDNSSSADIVPSFDDLRVRFYYRATADAGEDFAIYPLFGIDNNTMPLTRFMRRMQNIGISSYEWCDVCGSTPAPWCSNPFNDGGASRQSVANSMDPAVAGVVGAVIMLVVVAIAGVSLYSCGGLRLRRRGFMEQEPMPEQVSAVGGFKGPEKMDDDKDVSVTKEGFHHERVGSWELKDGNASSRGGNGSTLGGSTIVPDQASGVGSADIPRERGKSFDDDEDDVSVMNATPVKAHESV